LVGKLKFEQDSVYLKALSFFFNSPPPSEIVSISRSQQRGVFKAIKTKSAVFFARHVHTCWDTLKWGFFSLSSFFLKELIIQNKNNEKNTVDNLTVENWRAPTKISVEMLQTTRPKTNWLTPVATEWFYYQCENSFVQWNSFALFCCKVLSWKMVFHSQHTERDC